MNHSWVSGQRRPPCGRDVPQIFASVMTHVSDAHGNTRAKQIVPDLLLLILKSHNIAIHIHVGLTSVGTDISDSLPSPSYGNMHEGHPLFNRTARRHMHRIFAASSPQYLSDGCQALSDVPCWSRCRASVTWFDTLHCPHPRLDSHHDGPPVMPRIKIPADR